AARSEHREKFAAPRPDRDLLEGSHRTVMRGIDLTHALQAEICRFRIGLGTKRLCLRHGGTPQPISTTVRPPSRRRQRAAAFPTLNDIGGVHDRTVVALETLERDEMITLGGAGTAVGYQGDVIVDEVSVPSGRFDTSVGGDSGEQQAADTAALEQIV